jgi:MoaA/NifB/PqqE/SkfB family radical SAM enzyme
MKKTTEKFHLSKAIVIMINLKFFPKLKNTETSEPNIISGWKLIFTSLKIWARSLKYIIRRKKYPLFLLRSCIPGLMHPQKALELTKIVKFQKRYYLSLLKAPHWPSPPFDNYVAHGGLNIKAAGTSLKSHIDFVILAITRKCLFHCQHCYEYYNLGNPEIIPLNHWIEVLRGLQQLGVGTIVFSGGEPMLRYDDLVVLLEAGDKKKSDFHLHTSGQGVTYQKALALRQAGLDAAGVGLDDPNPDRQNYFRGNPNAYDYAIQAVECFRKAGIFPYLNNCLTSSLIRNGDLWNYLELAKQLKAGCIQLYEPKPCGKYLSCNYENLFSTEDRQRVTEFFKIANHSKKYRHYPKVTYVDYYENADHLGCLMGGLFHFYIDSQGNVQPCVFMPVSFGNILQEDIQTIFFKMRKDIPRPPKNGCPAKQVSQLICEHQQLGLKPPVNYEAIQTEWQDIVKNHTECVNKIKQ